MRSPTINSVAYVPGDTQDRFLRDELLKISAAINALALGHVDTSYAAPVKPRDGDIRLADGTTWNPGSGQGVYAYYNGAWHLLG